jgi:hypothetical protein
MLDVTHSAPVCNRPASDRREYLLAELRCAALRAKLWQHDIEAIGVALKGCLIEPEQAVALLDDCDALRLLNPEGDWQ